MNVLIASGGTGGHIYPGIAIAQKLKKEHPEANIVFVGSYVGMENRIIPPLGYPLERIRSRGFEKGFSKETIAAVIGTLESFRDAGQLLKKYKPDLVIGTGGFTGAVLLFLAALKKIPTLIHEQNAYPGRANRLLGKVVDRVGLAFPEAAKFFDKDKVFYAGNPVRETFKHLDRKKAREKLGLEDEKFVLFMGGSQGAHSINEAAAYVIENYKGPRYVLIAGAEKENLKRLEDKAEVFEFYEDMATLMAAADLIVARSGATTISEITASELPSVLIPYPLAAGDHQSFNARTLGENGAAIVISDKDLNGPLLKETVKGLLEDESRLEAMRRHAGELKVLDADGRIVEELCKLNVFPEAKDAGPDADAVL